MKFSLLAATLVASLSTFVHAADPFDGIKCGDNIAQKLIGRNMGNGSSKATERKHRDLQLVDQGGEIVTDDIFEGTWRICGNDYSILTFKNSIRDVKLLPQYSGRLPYFSGACQRRSSGKEEYVSAVLNGDVQGDWLPATLAWTIDEKKAKYIPVRTDGLLCPRSGIVNGEQH